MSTVTIEITEQQEKFLEEFAAKHYEGSKDNVATKQPIHLVQTQRERVVNPDYENYDVVKYIVPDWDYKSFDSAEELIRAWYEDEECSINILSFQEAYDCKRFTNIYGEEVVILDEKDYLEAYGIEDENYSRVFSSKYYETVAYFFILDQAKEYIKYQGHNLSNPRTYTVGAGYANKGEYHHFWELLFNLGKQLSEEAVEIKKEKCLGISTCGYCDESCPAR